MLTILYCTASGFWLFLLFLGQAVHGSGDSNHLQDMVLSAPIVPLSALKHALFKLQVTTSRDLRRSVCYQCLRNAASEKTLRGHYGTTRRRRASSMRPLHMQRPGSGVQRTMATVSHCETAWSVLHEARADA